MPAIVNYKHDDPYLTVSTPDELDRVLDDLHRLSSDGGEPVLADMTPVNADGSANVGIGMYVGAHGDKGFLCYGRNTPELAVRSDGSDAEGVVTYWFQETNTNGVPAAAEIPYEDVRRAAQEFLETGGDEPPDSIRWVPFEGWKD